ncbi:MAG: hypothetical protein JSW07_09045, partial [bacterium]
MRNDLAEDGREVQQIELARLDDLFNAIWGKAMDGKLPECDRILKIMERREKLLGLDKERR